MKVRNSGVPVLTKKESPLIAFERKEINKIASELKKCEKVLLDFK